MQAIEAVNMLLTLVQAAANTAASIQLVGAIIQRAQQEGRTELNSDEILQIQQLDNAARAQLVAELNKRLAA